MFNTFGRTNSFGRPSRRVVAVGIVQSDLTLHLDAADLASYPGTGSTWTDLAAPEQNVTLFGSPTFTSGTPSYFSFNGSSQYGVGSGNNVVPSTAYTKSVWFYINSYSDNNLVSSDTGGHFMFMASTNKIYCGHSNWSTYTEFPSVSSISLNTWYNATLTFSSADGMKLYLNGSLDATYTANKSQRSGNGGTNIACFGAGGNMLDGRISLVMCYSRELTAAEVTQNYNNYKSRFGL
jgi:hypothetical protein